MNFIELPKPLILASRSPRRAQLLRQIGLEFDVIPANIDETADALTFPEKLAADLARQKAQAVAAQIGNGLVVGADTMVVLAGKILGKPKNAAEAREMLRLLSGNTHEVFTGFAIISRPENLSVTGWEQTAVTFRELDDWEINRYIEIDHPFDKAGAYGIQDMSALFVESIHGCYYNVVGFPLTKFYVSLKSFLIKLEQ